MVLIIIAIVIALLALAGIGIGLYLVKRVHDEIRSCNRHLAEQVDVAIIQGTRIVR